MSWQAPRLERANASRCRPKKSGYLRGGLFSGLLHSGRKQGNPGANNPVAVLRGYECKTERPAQIFHNRQSLGENVLNAKRVDKGIRHVFPLRRLIPASKGCVDIRALARMHNLKSESNQRDVVCCPLVFDLLENADSGRVMA